MNTQAKTLVLRGKIIIEVPKTTTVKVLNKSQCVKYIFSLRQQKESGLKK